MDNNYEHLCKFINTSNFTYKTNHVQTTPDFLLHFNFKKKTYLTTIVHDVHIKKMV